MNAVGDGVDLKLRKHGAGDLGVFHGHAVGIAREAQRQQRHIQHAISKAAHPFKTRGAISAQNAVGLLGIEAVVPGGNRSMRGEDALPAHLGDVELSYDGLRAAAELAFEQGERQKRGVAFIHVINIYIQAEGLGHAHAGHAENDLLLKAVAGVAAVEMIGEGAILGTVAVEVSVEKIDGNDVAGAAFKIVAPGAHGYRAVFNGDGNPCFFLGAELRRVPRLILFTLDSLRAQMLREVSLAMQKRKSGEGNIQIGCRTQGVSCQNPETAGVGGHGGADGNFHREVCDQARGRESFKGRGKRSNRLHDLDVSARPLREEAEIREKYFRKAALRLWFRRTNF